MKLKWRDIEKEEPKKHQKILAFTEKMIVSGVYIFGDFWGHFVKVEESYFNIIKWIPIEEFYTMFETD